MRGIRERTVSTWTAARTRTRVAIVGAALAAGLLAGCGSTSSAADGSEGGGSPGPIRVVTSTSVWGDVVALIGGDRVAVTAIVTDPAADPHSFEPSAQVQLAVSKADLIVENGGGYDSWMDAMVAAAGTRAPVVNAVNVAGLDEDAHERSPGETAAIDEPAGAEPAEDEHARGAVNEHVWFDPTVVGRVGEQVAAALSAIRPDEAAQFRDGAAALVTQTENLTADLDAIRATHAGTPIAVTEPLPIYLTEAAGLRNETPQEFSDAIEEGTDVPPTVLRDAVALVSDRRVDLLVYNEQTSAPETEDVRAAAEAAGVPVLGVTETLPEGKDYLTWMRDTIAALEAALG